MVLAEYVHVGALSVMIWDVLNHCKKDYHLLFSFDPCAHATLYAVTRYMTLAYVLAKTLYLTIQIPHCGMLGSAIAALYVLAVSGTLLLSSIRLWKLLDRKTNVFIAVGALWLFAVGGSVTYAVGVVGGAPAPPALGAEDAAACVDRIKGEYVAVAFIVVFVYHLCLLVAVLLAIRQNVFADRTRLSLPERYERMARGASALFLAQPLTMDDRVFHVSATVTSLASLLWFYASSVGNHAASLRLMLAPIYLVSTNILIGRVSRNSTLANLLLQAPHEPPPPIAKLNLQTNALHVEVTSGTAGHRKRTLCDADTPINRVVKISMDGSGERGAPEGYGDAKRGGSPVEVQVQRVTEHKTDFFGVRSELDSEGSIQTDGLHHDIGIRC